MVAVAQLVESRIVIPVVVGSSPISHPKEFKQKAQFIELGFLLLRLEIRNCARTPLRAFLRSLDDK
ncbi:hypothetical protein PSP6_160086 [Paraburkholderia tropica]|nr:hypothetical protein PSP6_160086 [Paraburkholderia tropica]